MKTRDLFTLLILASAQALSAADATPDATPNIPTAIVTTPFPALPKAVTSFGAAMVGDGLYVYGGHQGRAHSYYEEAQAHTLWRLQLKDSAEWEDLGKGPRLQGLAMVADQQRLYRLGGFTAKNKDGEEQDLWSQAAAAVYDVASKKWSDLPPLPEPRSSFDAAVLDGTIYVVGGWQMRGDQDKVWHQTAHAMDLSEKPKWSTLPAPPFRRRALAAAAYDGKIFAIGGMQPDGKTTTRVDIYDVDKQQWTQGPSLVGKTMEGFGASAFATGGRLYVSTYAGNLQRLSEDGKSWEVVATLERARFFHRMLPLSATTLLSVGGASMDTGKFAELDVIRVDAFEKAKEVSTSKASVAWGGFQNGGRVTIDAPVPLKWSAESALRWKTPLAGYGQSSPVISGQTAYVTSTSGDMKQNLHVQAISLAEGKEMWRYDAKNSSPEKNTSYVSRAAPSPVCDAQGLIALFEGGNLVALDTKGEVRWSKDLVKDYGAIQARHGLSSSLEQNASHVFVWVERQTDPYLLALSKQDGKTVWKSEGLGGTSWSSPRLIPVGDSSNLVLSGNSKVVGYDPASGEKLWTVDGVNGNTSATPVPIGDGRFVIGASEGRGESGGGNAAASNGVIQILVKDGKYSADYVWRAKRASSSFGSPIVHDGLAYFVNRVGVVYCLDAATGKQKYAERSAGSVWATPLVVNDRIYLFGRNGDTTVLKSGPQFTVLATNTLWERKSVAANAPPGMGFGGPVLYAAAVAADGTLLLRRGDVLFAVGPE